MNIPKKIRIGGIDHPIKYKDNLRNENDERLYGQIDLSASVITLSSDPAAGKERITETLLHEIIHGVLYHAGVTEFEDEEHVCNVVSRGLYQVIADNPTLFRTEAGKR